MISPVPALVHKTSVPHFAQRYLLPNELATVICLLKNIESGYFLISMGSLQHFTVPVPPLVTMNSAPHFTQRYLLPTTFAIFRASFQIRESVHALDATLIIETIQGTVKALYDSPSVSLRTIRSAR
jgi:hypothetical protein